MITSKVGDFTLLRDEFQPTYMGNKQESLVEVYTYTDFTRYEPHRYQTKTHPQKWTDSVFEKNKTGKPRKVAIFLGNWFCWFYKLMEITLPETNSSPMKIPIFPGKYHQKWWNLPASVSTEVNHLAVSGVHVKCLASGMTWCEMNETRR